MGNSNLTTASYQVLDEVAELLKNNPEIKVIIEGHTSIDGTYDANLKLSKSRAEKVREYLVAKGVGAERLSSVGYGPDRPLNNGKTEIEKAKNRRVELRLSNQ